MKKILVLMVLSLVGLTSIFANEYANKQQELFETPKARMWTEWLAPKTKRAAPKTKATDPNIERYLEMKMKAEVEADEFFEREVLGWEEVEPDLKAWSNGDLR